MKLLSSHGIYGNASNVTMEKSQFSPVVPKVIISFLLWAEYIITEKNIYVVL